MSMYKSNINSTPIPLPNGFRDSLLVNGRHGRRGRSTTPIGRVIPANAVHLMSTIEGDLGAEEDPRLAIFRELYVKSEARLNALLGEEGEDGTGAGAATGAEELEVQDEVTAEASAIAVLSAEKPTRNINEDDYDESDDEDEDDSVNASPLKSRSNLPTINLPPSALTMLRGHSASSTTASVRGAPSSVAGKTTEEARKKLEEDKKATEEAAKRSFNTVFFTLENDKDAMLEQKKLEESERLVDVEMGVAGASGSNVNGGGTAQQGTLSQTNLGASSLALKNLIRVIDGNRDRVPATDVELRTLFSDVRKGRGKWASEEKVGKEELYEAAETVLNTLRGFTEHSSPFLTRVNRKEAPDYSNSKFT
jgi:transcriptional activator SPT7